jgi:hypothetical protein
MHVPFVCFRHSVRPSQSPSLMEARLNMTAFWDTALGSLVHVDWRFRGDYYLHNQDETTTGHTSSTQEGRHLQSVIKFTTT